MRQKNSRPTSGQKEKKDTHATAQLTIEYIEEKLDELCMKFLTESDGSQNRELFKRIRNYADRERRLYESILDDLIKEEKLLKTAN